RPAAPAHGPGVGPPKAVASQRLLSAAALVGPPPPRLLTGPGEPVRLGPARPPGLVRKAPPPVRAAWRRLDPPVTPFFVRADAGSGRVSPCWARFQPPPRRLRTRRLAAPRRGRGVQPLAWQTGATRGSVPRLVGLPKVRGDCCGQARQSSSRPLGQAVW